MKFLLNDFFRGPFEGSQTLCFTLQQSKVDLAHSHRIGEALRFRVLLCGKYVKRCGPTAFDPPQRVPVNAVGQSGGIHVR